jgi:hypothetical protein
MEDFLPAAARREAESLRQMITVLQDGPRRLRVVRFTPAQQGAAKLIAGGLSVPADAQARLDGTLRAGGPLPDSRRQLGRGTRARSGVAAACRGAPVGRGISLRLVVTPLGVLGLRLAPGHGRAQLMATIGGETHVTYRDLDAEHAHVAEVFEALPFLVQQAPAGGEHLDAGRSRGRADRHRGVARADRRDRSRMAAWPRVARLAG